MTMTRKRLLRIGFYGMTGLIFAFVLLDPYTRQSVFGPKLHGEPLCYWQDEFRREAVLEAQFRRGAIPQQPAMLTVLAYLGIKSQHQLSLNHANVLPIALSLIDDPSPTVRAAVAQCLGQYAQSPDANAGLVLLLDDPHTEVRLAALEACLHIGDRAAPAVARLHQVLDDEDLPSRVFAASALVRIDGAADKKTLTVLLEGLGAPNQWARMAAARSICRLGQEHPECLTDVASAARRDVYVRIGFADAADAYGAVAIPLLIELLGDSDDRVTCRAAHSLGELGPAAKPAIPALVLALSAPGINTQKFGYEALSKIDPERYPQKKGAGEQ